MRATLGLMTIYYGGTTKQCLIKRNVSFKTYNKETFANSTGEHGPLRLWKKEICGLIFYGIMEH